MFRTCRRHMLGIVLLLGFHVTLRFAFVMHGQNLLSTNVAMGLIGLAFLEGLVALGAWMDAFA